MTREERIDHMHARELKPLSAIAASSVLTEDQLRTIEETIVGHGQFTTEAIREELEWYCTGLVMSPYYFETTPLPTIAAHIEALKAAEIMSTLRGEDRIRVDLGTELEHEATYLIDDDHFKALEIERRIEARYPNHRLQSYRTERKAKGLGHLRMYLVTQPRFAGGVESVGTDVTDLRRVADEGFLRSVTSEVFTYYQNLLNRSKGWESPLIDVVHEAKTKELRITVVVNRDTSPGFFANVSDVLHSRGFVSSRKYVNHFANGKTVYAFFLDGFDNRACLEDLISDISLVYVIPESPLSSLFREGKLSAQEMVFGVAATSFAHQFLSTRNEEYLKLSQALEGSPELQGVLRDMKTNLAKDTYTESRVWEALLENADLLKRLYRVFEKKFNPAIRDHDVAASLRELNAQIGRRLTVDIDRDVFRAVLRFVEVTRGTSFFIREKTSLAFELEPEFLNSVDYPVAPYSVILVIGAEFRGFHVRFRNIARGGIRIVRSANLQVYLNNSDFIFDENYNLASTQQRKNKDIPEGGSKGTILLAWGSEDKAVPAFKKYVDGLLDLMLPGEGKLEPTGVEMILFLGPDEGTAELMEWAALRAKRRGYRFWKAFTTGKPESMGGVPHDLYGMTTASVHEYVVRSLGKLELAEEAITKVMTGGPDGDLGSNEILISKDRILAIVDGSGVLCDPAGIDRGDLVRLARARKMVENFDRSKLSGLGFFVGIRDQDVTLPHGELVENGMEFRNTFHLHPLFAADIFVPCGGRPSSININNWRSWLDGEGRPRFKVIVEGANLFLTQQARLRLEEKGVIVYKDASANKGGVTSSSLEVLASLAMTDQEFDELMCVQGGVVPEFRKRYVAQILDSIRYNAAQEFELIWREWERTGTPRAVLTDKVSEKINLVKDAVARSALAQDDALVLSVAKCCLPPVLVERIGLEKLVERVPRAYFTALFASRLAAKYVYAHGLEANEIDFYMMLSSMRG
jgi:glutamate dehydrogenase